MSLVRFSGVLPQTSAEIRACSIDRPTGEWESQTHSIHLEGWILTRERPIARVELACQKALLGSSPLNRPRPDVQQRHPTVKEAASCGFRLLASAVGLPRNFKLVVRVVLDNERRLPVCVVEGSRALLPPGPSSQVQPLMVTTLGRTGSTWLTHLLGQHPEILAYRPFQYETRVANYWAQILMTLSEPNSYLHALATEMSGRHWWLGDRQPPAALPLLDPEIESRLGAESINSLASFCREQTERFYRTAATIQGKDSPAFFVEKCSPSNFLQETISEIYPGAREIVLVRDFRDMLCSILAYNRKRRMTSFGRQFADSDEEYVRRLRTTAAQLLWSWQRRPASAHVTRYEDLIRKPAETLKSILQYLGLSASDAIADDMLERACKSRADAQTMHKTSSSWESSIGRWKRELEPGMADACESAFDDLLEEFGYEATHEPTA